jgi:ectoine hydroxylase-related dioxygenase (phytanoyl-CoA dioxygenase family)
VTDAGTHLAAAAADFQADGVALVRAAVRPGWVERLRMVAEDPDVNGRPFIFLRNPDCRLAAGRSGLGAIAARILGTPRVSLLYDEFLSKPPGRSLPTPPHQDSAYWPLEGAAVCTLWLALDVVDKRNGGVLYARGSHRLAGTYARAFVQAGQTEAEPDAGELRPPSDMASSGFELLSFDLEPGDAVVHHAATLHGAPANADASRLRRAYITRWIGPGTRYRPRKGTVDLPYAAGLATGATLDRCRLPTVRSLEITPPHRFE